MDSGPQQLLGAFLQHAPSDVRKHSNRGILCSCMKEHSSSQRQPLDPRLVKSVIAALAGEPITVAYMHGSYARGRADAESDLDVAILTDSSLSKRERWDLRLRVTVKLSQVLPSELEPDVIILQDVPLLLQYQVIRNGLVLHGRHAAERRDFEYEVERRYDDERPLLDQETDVILERILSLRS